MRWWLGRNCPPPWRLLKRFRAFGSIRTTARKLRASRIRRRSARPAPSVSGPSSCESDREFVLVVVRIEFGPQVDVMLRLSQSAEVPADVVRVRRALDHGSDHECRVDHLAEAELLGQIIWPVKKRRCWAFPLNQKLHPAKQHAILKPQIDLARWHVLFEGLNCRVMAT